MILQDKGKDEILINKKYAEMILTKVSIDIWAPLPKYEWNSIVNTFYFIVMRNLFSKSHRNIETLITTINRKHILDVKY